MIKYSLNVHCLKSYSAFGPPYGHSCNQMKTFDLIQFRSFGHVYAMFGSSSRNP